MNLETTSLFASLFTCIFLVFGLTACDSGGGANSEPEEIEVRVEGTVTDGDTQDPIEGVNINGKRTNDGEQLFETTTDSDGTYEASFSVKATNKPAEVTLSVSADGFSTIETTVDFSENIAEDFQFESRFAGGDGTTDDPYQVATVEQLQDVDKFPGSHYTQTQDIDASGTASWNEGKGFLPIGKGGQPFTGSFNGNDHDIVGLKILQESADTHGLFGVVENGTIQSTRLKEVEMRGGFYAGTLVGINKGGKVMDCKVEGTASKFRSVGGMVGENSGEIRSSVSAVVTSNGEGVAGGLVSKNMAGGVIVSSEASGKVSVTAPDDRSVADAGGLAGGNVGEIRRSQATGNVSGAEAGGLVASNGGLIEESFASGKVETEIEFGTAGGLVGTNGVGGEVLRSRAEGTVVSQGEVAKIGGLVGIQGGGVIRRSKATGSVEGSVNNWAGGLVGDGGDIHKSYSTGSVSAVSGSGPNGNLNVGGLIGRAGGPNGGDEIRESYATGSVSVENRLSDDKSIGGLIGERREIEITNSFWDSVATSQDSGAGEGGTDGITGLTTSEMQGASAEQNMDGFDFQGTWQSVTDDYPILAWED